MANCTKSLENFFTFETSFGHCSLGFSKVGITSFAFGENKVVYGVSNGSPAWVREAAERIQRHLGGQAQVFNDLPFDFGNVSPFFEAVYQALLQIPSGGTVSYKELAERAGRPRAVRAVGNAMARNRIPLLVPCHRVLASGGRAGGYTGGGGLTTKLRLLALEGVTLQH